MDRRDFLKNSMGGLSALVVGSSLLWTQNSSLQAAPHVQSLSFRITDALKEMVTHNKINKATCYFWVFKEENLPADCPGPIIFTREGEIINVSVTNDLNENHSFYIKDVVDSGPIAPGESLSFNFTAPRAGTYLYHDNLNSPVNRIMGLHGALVVMPQNRVPGNSFTPYSNPTREVQTLFNDLGDSRLFPGLKWEEGDPSTRTVPFRQHVWLLHAASPKLFAEVGRHPAGADYPADRFVELYTNDKYANTNKTGVLNRKPHFFTINGQSGLFSHHSPYITPWRRVGEPVVVRILNPGIATHALHIHCNHYFVLSVDQKVSSNIPWVDTFEALPLKSLDILIPFRRPPDVPNERGIGLADPPLISLRGKPVWPPLEEMNLSFPPAGTTFEERLSPLCYPMHDHVETTQNAQGGNYPLGIMSGMFVTGDRNTPGFMNFPDYPFETDIDPLNQTRVAAPPLPDHEHE